MTGALKRQWAKKGNLYLHKMTSIISRKPPCLLSSLASSLSCLCTHYRGISRQAPFTTAVILAGSMSREEGKPHPLISIPSIGASLSKLVFLELVHAHQFAYLIGCYEMSKLFLISLPKPSLLCLSLDTKVKFLR